MSITSATVFWWLTFGATAVGGGLLTVGLFKLGVAVGVALSKVDGLKREISSLEALIRKLVDLERSPVLPQTTEVDANLADDMQRVLAELQLLKASSRSASANGFAGSGRQRSLRANASRTETAQARPATAEQQVLDWWNRNRPTMATVEKQLPQLRAATTGHEITYLGGARPLIGLRFRPALPGYDDTLILPDMTATMGSLSLVFGPDSDSRSRVARVLQPACIPAQYFQENRDHLLRSGLRAGRAEAEEEG